MTTCRIDDCDKPREGRSTLCSMHRGRLKRTGDLNGIRTPAGPRPHTWTPLAERLRAKLAEGSPDECWLWGGRTDAYGYGTLTRGNGDKRMVRAHRVAYELAFGPIPDGLVVDHLCHFGDCEGICEHRRCCNPLHLSLSTIGANVSRSMSERQSVATECRHGHPMPENRRAGRDGRTYCESCRQRWDRASYQRRKARRST